MNRLDTRAVRAKVVLLPTCFIRFMSDLKAKELPYFKQISSDIHNHSTSMLKGLTYNTCSDKQLLYINKTKT